MVREKAESRKWKDEKGQEIGPEETGALGTEPLSAAKRSRREDEGYLNGAVYSTL